MFRADPEGRRCHRRQGISAEAAFAAALSRGRSGLLGCGITSLRRRCILGVASVGRCRRRCCRLAGCLASGLRRWLGGHAAARSNLATGLLNIDLRPGQHGPRIRCRQNESTDHGSGNSDCRFRDHQKSPVQFARAAMIQRSPFRFVSMTTKPVSGSRHRKWRKGASAYN